MREKWCQGIYKLCKKYDKHLSMFFCSDEIQIWGFIFSSFRIIANECTLTKQTSGKWNCNIATNELLKGHRLNWSFLWILAWNLKWQLNLMYNHAKVYELNSHFKAPLNFILLPTFHPNLPTQCSQEIFIKFNFIVSKTDIITIIKRKTFQSNHKNAISIDSIKFLIDICRQWSA